MSRYPHVIRFEPADGDDFAALHAAEAWLRTRGWSWGSLQSRAPCGIIRGDAGIGKWRHLNQASQDAMDGIMVGMRNGSFRFGAVEIRLRRPDESPTNPEISAALAGSLKALMGRWEASGSIPTDEFQRALRRDHAMSVELGILSGLLRESGLLGWTGVGWWPWWPR